MTAGPDAATGDGPAALFRELTAIRTPDGIDEQRFVEIGGIPQWISLRGRDRSAPVLLFLNGGPGFTASFASHAFMAGWEEYFVLVLWDQRGAGRTFGATPVETVRPTMSIERMVADAVELVGYLRDACGVPRIVLVGHSWGSVLGLMLAQRHPGWIEVYVGVSQIVDMAASEAASLATVIAEAEARGDDELLAAARELAPYPDPTDPVSDLRKLIVQRGLLARVGGLYHAAGTRLGDIAQDLNPLFTPSERDLRNRGIGFGAMALWGEIARVSFEHVATLRCRAAFVVGIHDRAISLPLLEHWYERLEAPEKRYVSLSASAHFPIEEEPARFLAVLRQIVFDRDAGATIAGSVDITCSPGTVGGVVALMLAFRARARAHDGCRAYEVARHVDRDDVVTLFEIWRDERALADHMARPETIALNADLRDRGARIAFTRYDGPATR